MVPLCVHEIPRSDADHESPPRRMNPSPEAGVVEAQLAEQLGIPGMCAHGELSEVPLLESEPADFET